MTVNKNWDIFFDDEVKELTKLNLPDPETLDYYERAINREIFWNFDIDDSLVEYSLMIIKWNKQDKGKPSNERVPIKILINSNGGELPAVLNFINVIQLSKTPVYTIGFGKTYSSGGLMLLAGAKGHRYVFQDTTALVHSGSTGAVGNTDKVLDNFEFTQRQEKRVKDFIVANTNITEKLYTKNYRKDWWLMSDEIISLGLADKIVTDLDEIF
ncbi:ATP-dependent Clp protease proteolytic subunit [Clostridium lacusfryxellense]|uniref:ATP-dependent Clp protease proteolytic subunit n=1 Tax=Clostridium lacusfryxellense TaxID=205328 RepID=UPI001C0B3D9B|nr:ATP-dependent Clp protease proteolytic subunit [Clostridium lacusfryxellense]MBU3112364.1 ATP-dependent Clp protease proteolytic subunit [Clostridium lacusfryxellense]